MLPPMVLPRLLSRAYISSLEIYIEEVLRVENSKTEKKKKNKENKIVKTCSL